MIRTLTLTASAFALAACTSTGEAPHIAPASQNPDAPTLKSGIDIENLDKTVRPQDDFYRYVNGNWLKRTEIPADKPEFGSFTELADLSEKRLRGIIDESASAKDKKPGTD